LSVFPSSIHLLCSVHKRDNITRKLHEFKIEEAQVKVILADIFGSSIDDAYFKGLVDSEGSEDFLEKLEMLKPKWESLCEGFLEWFIQYEVEPMCSFMIASVCTLAGLGKPPLYYTTNGIESLNNLLKRKVNFKRHKWPRFNEILHDAVKEQQAEFEKAIFCQGEYEVLHKYKHLQVSHLDWIQMSSEQRKVKIEKAQKVKLYNEL